MNVGVMSQKCSVTNVSGQLVLSELRSVHHLLRTGHNTVFSSDLSYHGSQMFTKHWQRYSFTISIDFSEVPKEYSEFTSLSTDIFFFL